MDMKDRPKYGNTESLKIRSAVATDTRGNQKMKYWIITIAITISICSGSTTAAENDNTCHYIPDQTKMTDELCLENIRAIMKFQVSQMRPASPSFQLPACLSWHGKEKAWKDNLMHWRTESVINQDSSCQMIETLMNLNHYREETKESDIWDDWIEKKEEITNKLCLETIDKYMKLYRSELETYMETDGRDKSWKGKDIAGLDESWLKLMKNTMIEVKMEVQREEMLNEEGLCGWLKLIIPKEMNYKRWRTKPTIDKYKYEELLKWDLDEGGYLY